MREVRDKTKGEYQLPPGMNYHKQDQNKRSMVSSSLPTLNKYTAQASQRITEQEHEDSQREESLDNVSRRIPQEHQAHLSSEELAAALRQSRKKDDHVDNFNRALDSYIYDKDDNDINRRANRAHNLRGNLKFVGTGHPTGNEELEKYKKIQKVALLLDLEHDLQKYA